MTIWRICSFGGESPLSYGRWPLLDWRTLVEQLLGLGETEESIADRLSVNQSTVSRWLTGRNGPRYEQGVKLMELLRELEWEPQPEPEPPPQVPPPEYGRRRGRLS